MESNQIEGALRDVKGKVKDGVGGLIGDVGLQADGKLDQAAGKLQGTFGDAMNATTEAVQAAGAKAGEVIDRTVQQQPLLAAVGMMAIGYLAAFLIHAASSPLTPPPPPRARRMF